MTAYWLFCVIPDCCRPMITAKAITALPKGATLWDEKIQGLHVRCTAAGKKGFFYYYRTKARQERRPKIGDVGIMSIDQARAEAQKMAVVVAAGGDPVAERTAVRLEPTMRHLCAKYLWTHARHKKDRRKYRGMVDRYVIPLWGERKVKSMEYGDIAEQKTKMKNKPVTFNRLRSLLSKMFNLAERWQFRPQNSNPCRHVDRNPEKKRKVYVKDDEAPRIAAVLAKYEATRPQAVLFIYLLILSGARPIEIARAKPEYIEPRPVGEVLRLKEHKTDGTGEDRLIYLPPQVAELRRRTPGTQKSLTGIQSPKALWDIVRKEANVPHIRLYDLRHTFASAALRAGYSLGQIGELLGHRSTQTTQRYAHIMDELAQTAAAETAAVLERMMKQPAPTPSEQSLLNKN